MSEQQKECRLYKTRSKYQSHSNDAVGSRAGDLKISTADSSFEMHCTSRRCGIAFGTPLA